MGVARRSVHMVIWWSTSLLWYVASPSTASSSGLVADEPPEGLVWLPGGIFTMGAEGGDARPDESPRHRVRVHGFFMGIHEVTNAEFERFVEATGYRTVAERAVDWAELQKQLPPGSPKPPDEMLQPGSLVFTPPSEPVPLNQVSSWWTWTTKADWRHPEGPGSNIEGRENHPVVHVAWEDAVAYCDWVGGRLPTEAEWEFAARGGLEGTRFVWGDGDLDATRANVWTGDFPHRNDLLDGHVRTASVGSYPANGFGLFDMAGNVWEWCSDRYRADEYRRRTEAIAEGDVVDDPQGPSTTIDPRHPHAPVTRIQRGGSFLCHPSYCSSYRPSARMATTPDSAASHVGFRVVMTKDQARAQTEAQAEPEAGDAAASSESPADPTR